MSLILLSLISLFSCKMAENEIFILPKDYTGYVLIIFNQRNGTPEKYEEKKRVYEIPQNGILRTAFAPNDGWTDFPEFYYEKILPGNQIPFKAEYKNIPIDTVVAYGGTSGSVKKSAQGEERVIFVEFYIGTKAQIEQAQINVEKLDIVKLAE